MHPSGQGVLLLHRRGETWQGTLGLCFQAGFTPCIPPPPGKNPGEEPESGASSRLQLLQTESSRRGFPLAQALASGEEGESGANFQNTGIYQKMPVGQA